MVAVMLPMAQQLSNRRISYGTAKNPSLRLDGKTALVTGASSGIGLACAVALAEAGAEVTAAARSEDKLDTLVEAAQEKG